MLDEDPNNVDVPAVACSVQRILIVVRQYFRERKY